MSRKQYKRKSLNRAAHRKEEKIAKAVQVGSVVVTTTAALAASILWKKRRG
jgi:hypothetical protein